MIRCTIAVTFLVCAAGLAPAQSPEFHDLFNGKDMDGWVVEGAKKNKEGNAVWSVKDGLLTCDTGRGAYGFLRWEKQEYADFILRVEYRMTPPSKDIGRGNSGLGIRTPPYDPAKSSQTRPSYAAYEVQLLDDAGKPPDKHSSGSLYRYVAPSMNPVKAGPEWNTIEVECVGPQIRVTINGQKVVDVDQTKVADLTRAEDPTKPADAPAPKDKPLKGYVSLQSHTGKVEFRKVQIAELKSADKP
jgi:hypothetical protein